MVPAAAAETSSKGRRAETSRLRILIAEDSQDCADTSAMLLRHFGYEVEIARNGRVALAAAEARRPDVLLLDIGLPELDGYEVARRLKEKDGAARPVVIAVSGFGRDADRQCSAESGIDIHLVKPVDFAHLRSLLQSLAKDSLAEELALSTSACT